MTLAEAVAILNERRHGGHSNWYVADPSFVRGEDQYECFSGFEAIAIAEKYARETRIAAKKEKGQIRKQRRREIRQRRAAREARYQRIIDSVLSTGLLLDERFLKLRAQVFEASRGYGLENIRNRRAQEIREQRGHPFVATQEATP